MAETLFQLLIAHAIADFGLQSNWLARNKNRHQEDIKGMWIHALFSHALIHAGMTLLFTSSTLYALIMLITHYFIDLGKCEGKYYVHTDQLLHMCVILFISIIFYI